VTHGAHIFAPAETAQRQQRIEVLAGELKELADKTRDGMAKMAR
jgi:hypothetical protein